MSSFKLPQNLGLKVFLIAIVIFILFKILKGRRREKREYLDKTTKQYKRWHK